MDGAEPMSYAEYGALIDRLATVLAGADVDWRTVIGVSRGGLGIAADLSHRLDAGFGVVEAQHYDGTDRQEQVTISGALLGSLRPGPVVVVDEIADTGDTLAAVKGYVERELEERYPDRSYNCRTATLHQKPHTDPEPDFYVETVERVRYPWEEDEIWD